MKINKSLLSGSTGMLILGILKDRDQYGYEMIESLNRISENVFEMKEGTLYPVLHSLEKAGYLKSYEQENEGGRRRKYYHVTKKGHRQLAEQKEEWRAFSGAVNAVLEMGCFA